MLTIQKLPLCSKGAPVAITLENSNHMRVTLLSYGATIQSIVVPDRNGVLTDVLLGYETVKEYEENDGYLGACIGRNGNRIAGAAFTLNGIGNFNGVPTAYDTGTGTLKEYRGTGLATEIFRHSMPHLRRAGVGQYLLEVLQHNTGAVSVYRNLGFETVREFNYFCRANTEIADRGDTPRLPHSVRRIDPEKFASISSFWDFTPSWQNSFESIGRAAGDFVSLGVFTEEELAGYCVFEPASGDVAQIAVKRQYRRKGIAGLLLREMLRLNRNDSLKIINTDVSCGSITGFLQAKNIVPQGKQFEMIRKI